MITDVRSVKYYFYGILTIFEFFPLTKHFNYNLKIKILWNISGINKIKRKDAQIIVLSDTGVCK